MSDYFGEARDRMDARVAERTDRELELRMAALGSLALGDREATANALRVLADWWEEVGDVRGPATRALLDKATAGRPHGWSIDTHSRRTVLSGSFATADGAEAATVRSWDGPTVEADAGGGYDAQIAVLLGGEPFPAPVETEAAKRIIPAPPAYEEGRPIDAPFPGQPLSREGVAEFIRSARERQRQRNSSTFTPIGYVSPWRFHLPYPWDDR